MKIHYTISLRVLSNGWTVEVYLPNDNTLLAHEVFKDPAAAVIHGADMLKKHIIQYPQGKP